VGWVVVRYNTALRVKLNMRRPVIWGGKWHQEGSLSRRRGHILSTSRRLTPFSLVPPREGIAHQEGEEVGKKKRCVK